jgi:hypothetical protein
MINGHPHHGPHHPHNRTEGRPDHHPHPHNGTDGPRYVTHE